jgi:hypothetical protein
MPMMQYTLIGEIGAFLFNLLVLIIVVKINKYSGNTFLKHFLLLFYFPGWVIASLISWYILHMIQLGEFFAICVILPVIIAPYYRPVVNWIREIIDSTR